MTEDITRMLSNAVPEDSDPQEWGTIARKRSQRRRAGQVSAVAALVLAVGIPVGMALVNPRETAVPAQTPSPTAVPASNPCADLRTAASQGEYRTPLEGGKLPDGAVQAWLCADSNNTNDVGPAEPLTAGLADLVSTFNALEAQPADLMCTMEYRYTYTLAFDYPGDRKVVSGELHGCRSVSDGQAQLAGGEALLAKAKELWLAQRAESTPPAADLTACPPTSSLIMASPASVKAAFACTGTDATISAKELPADLVREIAASFAQHVVDEVPGQGISDMDKLILVDDWGSMITLLPLAGDGFAISDPAGDQNRYWLPPAELVAKIREQFPEPNPDQPSMDLCIAALAPATTELTDFSKAYACTVRSDGGILPIAIDDDLARAVATQSEGLWAPSNEEPVHGPSMVLVDKEGAAHTLQYQPDGRLMRYDAEYQLLVFTPDADLAVQLAELLGN